MKAVPDNHDKNLISTTGEKLNISDLSVLSCLISVLSC